MEAIRAIGPVTFQRITKRETIERIAARMENVTAEFLQSWRVWTTMKLRSWIRPKTPAT